MKTKREAYDLVYDFLGSLMYVDSAKRNIVSGGSYCQKKGSGAELIIDQENKSYKIKRAVVLDVNSLDVWINYDKGKHLFCDPLLFLSKKYTQLLIDDDKVKAITIMAQKKPIKRYVYKPPMPDYFAETNYKYMSKERSLNIYSVDAVRGDKCTRLRNGGAQTFGYQQAISDEELSREDTDSLFGHLAIADALAAHWSCEIECQGKSLIIPSTKKEMRELSDLREQPLTPAGRRKKIIHWVKTHYRRRGDKISEVKTHTRGLDIFNIDDFKVTIAPPALSMLDHPNPDVFKGSFSHHLYSSFKKEIL